MESTKALKRKTSDNRNDFVRNGAVNFIYLLCGLLVSRGTLLGTLAPFGASYAAAVPKKYLFSSLVGTAFGYILLKPTERWPRLCSSTTATSQIPNMQNYLKA